MPNDDNDIIRSHRDGFTPNIGSPVFCLFMQQKFSTLLWSSIPLRFILPSCEYLVKQSIFHDCGSKEYVRQTPTKNGRLSEGVRSYYMVTA